MTNVLRLYQHHASKSQNAFHKMMNDPVMKGVQYSQEEHFPHLRLLYNKYNRQDILLASPCAQECNGLVIDIEHGKLVTFTDLVGKDDGDPNHWDRIWELEKGSPGNFVTKMESGTVIRISYLDEEKKWLLSTNRKLDARNGYYGSGRSFYEKIEDLIQSLTGAESLQQKLDEDFDPELMYLLIFNDVRGNLPVQKSELILISAKNRSTLKNVPLNAPSWCRYPILLKNDEEIQQELKQGRGVVLHQKDDTKRKFDSFVYRNTFFHFQDKPILELFAGFLQQKDVARIEIIQKLYPQFGLEMNLIQNWFKRYAYYIFQWYKNIKIYHKGRLSPMSTTLSLVQKLHQDYLKHRHDKPMQLSQVEQMLSRCIGTDPELYLGHLLHLKQEMRL